MTAILRNTLLAFVAASAFAGSAMADQTVTNECNNTSTNKLWAGRCCGTGDSSCLGGGHDQDHGRDGRKR
ncbi:MULTISPECIES: hypothetical protein [unclassified Mesorhizobium]|uniref:hypothetical protein n=1 Tax=unclassified Mesorhizobium TaxID=325217 RepID=UPI000FCA071D|nr:MULTISPECIES: hypothetical protein [unclassified Mesorhizobium]RWD59642.1 MAG: hypothetical protein EOS36_24235 [Mesorhizobium sp.]RWE50735.1 MAG: hypothetical protein EOS79_04610 [Mesorhizobium sp.]TGP27239.1 hypothetical protein EN874_006345 [Mesorhizobium sp. M1D.F.Ca.ET.231.01.1.1]TGP39197.1 hypothetical protein EN877_06345 [Mesorhizobium sp. M1D.F.Ca.ET.234.01.1.1]TGS51406.1 hypothetical protein EN827_06345 [Mesorhizobium sp. M1D.F.Ca.ET.184.01.1.1]